LRVQWPNVGNTPVGIATVVVKGSSTIWQIQERCPFRRVRDLTIREWGSDISHIYRERTLARPGKTGAYSNIMQIDRSTSQRANDAYAQHMLRQQHPNSPVGVTTTQGPQRTTATTGAGASTSPNAEIAASATVSLSSNAQTFARALAAAQHTPDVRADRVAALRARFAGGNLEVDATKLAASMLKSVDS